MRSLQAEDDLWWASSADKVGDGEHSQLSQGVGWSRQLRDDLAGESLHLLEFVE